MLREYNSLKLGEMVRVQDRSMGLAEEIAPPLGPAGGLPSREAKVRRVGPAGFFVCGLATCFRWEDEGIRWSRIPQRKGIS
jgi:hypothetical protein